MLDGPPWFFWVVAAIIGSAFVIICTLILVRICKVCFHVAEANNSNTRNGNQRNKIQGNIRRREDVENGVGFSPSTWDAPPAYDNTYGDGFDIHTGLHHGHGIGSHDNGHHSGGHDSGHHSSEHHDSGGGGDTGGGCDSGGGDTGGGCDSGGGGDAGGGCDSGGGGCDSGGGGVD